jgi:hypothetical protein
MFEEMVDQKYIAENLNDFWVETPFQGYKFLDNKQKGEFGERFVERYMKSLNHSVKPAISSTAGHDRIINNIHTEIKFSLAHTDSKKKVIKDNCWTMNHVAVGKDWERLIFVGINSNIKTSIIKWFCKDDFIRLKDTYFKPQQGGIKGGNDDYISASKRLYQLTQEMRDISTW